MMLIEVPSNFFDNIFFFFQIINIITDKNETTILFVNTINDKLDNKKMNFCVNILAKLGYKINVIIDKEIPNYYQSILYVSKLKGLYLLDNNDVNFFEIFNYVQREMICLLGYKNIIFANKFKTHEIYSNDIININCINDIKKMESNHKNIIFLKEIAKLFNLNINNYVNDNNSLKNDLINIFWGINFVNSKNISKKIDVYKALNYQLKFKEEF